jgi:hypothetical protein
MASAIRETSFIMIPAYDDAVKPAIGNFLAASGCNGRFHDGFTDKRFLISNEVFYLFAGKIEMIEAAVHKIPGDRRFRERVEHILTKSIGDVDEAPEVFFRRVALKLHYALKDLFLPEFQEHITGEARDFALCSTFPEAAFPSSFCTFLNTLKGGNAAIFASLDIPAKKFAIMNTFSQLTFASEEIFLHINRELPGLEGSKKEVIQYALEACIFNIHALYDKDVFSHADVLEVQNANYAIMAEALSSTITTHGFSLFFGGLTSDIERVGIKNGGNSCYLNAAFQVIATIPALKGAFGILPDGDPRAAVQQKVHESLEYISTRGNIGKPYTGINSVRDVLHPAGVIESPRGQLDSGEVIESLYRYATGSSLSEGMRYVYSYVDIYLETARDVPLRDDLSMLGDLREQRRDEMGPVNLSVVAPSATYASRREFDNMLPGRNVSGKELLNSSLESVEEMEVRFNVIEGEALLSKEATALRCMTLSGEHVWPEVLPIRVLPEQIIVEDAEGKKGRGRVHTGASSEEIEAAAAAADRQVERGRFTPVDMPLKWSPPGTEGIVYSLQAAIRHTGGTTSREKKIYR